MPAKKKKIRKQLKDRVKANLERTKSTVRVKEKEQLLKPIIRRQ